MRETMAKMEKRLGDTEHFVRTHRSHIINLNYLAEIQVLESGDAVALLSQGDRVPVSRNYRKSLSAAAVAGG